MSMSWYETSARPAPQRPPLAADSRADVCIVGGGYTGLSAALHLAERGVQVLLLEAERAGAGASGRNGGQVGSGQRRDQDELEARHGRDVARRLWELAEEAKATVFDLVERHAIACDLKPGVLHVAHKPALATWGFELADKLARDYGYDRIEPLDRTALADHLGSEVYHGGWLDHGAAHLHPLAYARGLARAAEAAGAVIHEQTRVTGFAPGKTVRVETAAGSVVADSLLLGANACLGRLSPAAARHIMPMHNYIIATEPLGEARARALIPGDVAVADTKFVINYFRLSADRRLLFGGGESYRRRPVADVRGFVRPYLLRVFPGLADVRIDYGWGGMLAVTLRRMPHFGRLAPNILFAQGYSGHGVALATLGGKLMAEAVAGNPERFDLMAALGTPAFPGGTLLRGPAFTLGMLWYALRDRL